MSPSRSSQPLLHENDEAAVLALWLCSGRVGLGWVLALAVAGQSAGKLGIRASGRILILELESPHVEAVSAWPRMLADPIRFPSHKPHPGWSGAAGPGRRRLCSRTWVESASQDAVLMPVPPGDVGGFCLTPSHPRAEAGLGVFNPREMVTRQQGFCCRC